MLPGFLIIGAQKSGTTTASRILEMHPDVFIARPRETRFFVDDLLFAGGATVYERIFFADWDGQSAVGEKTPEYLVSDEAAGRIKETLGADVLLVALLRSPAARAYSHWRHNLQMLWEESSFEDALALEEQRAAPGAVARLRFGYLHRGRYASQLRRYLRHFPREHLLVLLFDDLVERQDETARCLLDFLGVEPGVPLDLPVTSGRPRLPRLERPVSPTEIPSREGPVPAPAGSVVWRFAGGRVNVIRNPSAAQAAYAERFTEIAPTAATVLSREREIDINRTLRNDIEETADLVGIDLSAWLG